MFSPSFIRRAVPQDAERLTALAGQSFVESHGASAPAADIEDYIARTYALAITQQELTDPASIIHIIYHGNEPAGFSKMRLSTPSPAIRNQCITKLDRLYLLAAFYDLKLGHALLQFNIDLSRRGGQDGMWLYTWIGNARAVRFYIRAGFEVIGHADFRISATHSNPNHQMFLKY